MALVLVMKDDKFQSLYRLVAHPWAEYYSERAAPGHEIFGPQFPLLERLSRILAQTLKLLIYKIQPDLGRFNRIQH